MQHAWHEPGTRSKCFKMAGPFLEVLASDLLFDVGHTGNGDAASSTSQGKCGGQWGKKKKDCRTECDRALRWEGGAQNGSWGNSLHHGDSH